MPQSSGSKTKPGKKPPRYNIFPVPSRPPCKRNSVIIKRKGPFTVTEVVKATLNRSLSSLNGKHQELKVRAAHPH
jgi:hypothetical protein